MNKWLKRYMELAELISTWSKDPNKKVGAVIVSYENNRILSTGYNGFPSKVKDISERLNNVDDKLLYTIHAELNAILSARGTNLRNCVIYTTFFPCSQCMGSIIQAGIKTIITYKLEDKKESKWYKSFEASRNMALEAGIELYEFDKNDFKN